MKKNLLKILILSSIMSIGINSVCFADLIDIWIPGEDMAWALEDFFPVIAILLLLAIIETISFYFLWKTQKENDVEKEKKEEKLKNAKYHLLFMLTVLTLLIPLINVVSLILLCVSIAILVISKNKEKAYNLLRYYLIIFAILFVGDMI